MSFKSGFISIVGRPNVGKSTLLNKILGEKIAIVSKKPQTTRNSIRGILSGEDYQMIFFDTPGLHSPTSKLDEYMVNSAKSSMKDTDIILFLIDAKKKNEFPGNADLIVGARKKNKDAKIFLAINKIDTIKKEKILEVIEMYKNVIEFDGIFCISAQTGEGVDVLLLEIRKNMQEGPKYFPDDEFTDQPEKVIVAEIIREKMLRLLNDEVPHGIGVEIDKFKDRIGKGGKELIDIDATIFCEKETHKAIIIGKGGEMIKTIGSFARTDIEYFLNTQVFLQLHIKVKKDWKNNTSMLRQLGYEKK